MPALGGKRTFSEAAHQLVERGNGLIWLLYQNVGPSRFKEGVICVIGLREACSELAEQFDFFLCIAYEVQGRKLFGKWRSRCPGWNSGLRSDKTFPLLHSLWPENSSLRCGSGRRDNWHPA